MTHPRPHVEEAVPREGAASTVGSEEPVLDAPVDPAEPGSEEPEPESPDPGVEATAALEAALTERDRYLDGLQRLKAEFENFRKRSERDRASQSAAAARELVSDLLPVVDNLERAGDALAEQPESVRAGIEMVRSQLSAVLAARGLSEIPAAGEPFDPNVHEAIAAQPSAEHEEGTVTHVVQKGYALSGAVLRPARVVVAGAAL